MRSSARKTARRAEVHGLLQHDVEAGRGVAGPGAHPRPLAPEDGAPITTRFALVVGRPTSVFSRLLPSAPPGGRGESPGRSKQALVLDHTRAASGSSDLTGTRPDRAHRLSETPPTVFADLFKVSAYLWWPAMTGHDFSAYRGAARARGLRINSTS
jgi:hypothetical protein